MKQKRWVQGVLVVSTVALLAAGCSVPGLTEKKQSIDAPPSNSQEAKLGEEDIVTGKTDGKNVQVTVYAKDPKGMVVPVTLNVPETKLIAKSALEYMVDGGPSVSLLPKGFTAILPKGTEIKPLDVNDEKTATVDFNKAFAGYDGKDERKIMEAITWTLTGFPSIKQVKIRVDGKDLSEMPVAKTPMDEPLSRAMGINLEKAESVDYTYSQPVTLYFTGQTDTQYKYYVPVTRLVKRSQDVAKTVMEELKKGPAGQKGLTAVLSEHTRVEEAKESEEGLVTVNFSGELLGEDKKVPEETLQSVVLSLTENTGAAKVQIKVNGDAQVTSTGKPVSRPSHVNPVKM
ncbi:hypothetical protein B7C51_05930 [Paenibacillus larvae subsp. pulvifaciens]|uniref:GerMN domain-containing protein n=1 Tax=Paenibacillus larvae subsp. pulvifaciens TaxID=1477 RepID=A0A1V0UQJ8_9BACL|nr:GerMN domain-containing protein [Paenibacillus larvae]ARF67454.1 hypothetical protein B7C51_05930 [Paenibacillus larvae subsp. pulvifaciens]